MSDNKWNEFLKSGSVLAYLNYAAEQKNFKKEEQKGENPNYGTDNKGNQRG